MQQILIYGAGKRGARMCQMASQLGSPNVSVLDSDPKKIGTDFYGYIIEPPEAIHHYYVDYVLYIAIANEDIKDEVLKNLQYILGNKIINELSYYSLILKLYEESPVINEYIRSLSANIPPKHNCLFDCYNGLGLGGVEIWTKDVCAGLIGQGMKDVYILSDGGQYTVPSILEGQIISTPIDHREEFSVINIKAIMATIAEKLPCDVITSHTNEVMLSAYLMKRFFKKFIRVLSVIHNGKEQYYNFYLDFRQCTDHYVATTKGIYTDMIAYGLNPQDISYCGMPFLCQKELRRTYTLEETTPVCIGFAGRMQIPQKRVDLILKLMEELDARNVAFSFELAGDGFMRKKMEETIAGKRFGRQVKFLGILSREDMLPFWERQDICINLSDFEGRCLTIGEAMGCGAVPVVTDTSGPREDIVDGVNGYIVPLGDYKTAADRIEYLSLHRELLPKMGRRAHDEVYPKSLMAPHLEFWERLLLTEKAI